MAKVPVKCDFPTRFGYSINEPEHGVYRDSAKTYLKTLIISHLVNLKLIKTKAYTFKICLTKNRIPLNPLNGKSREIHFSAAKLRVIVYCT